MTPDEIEVLRVLAEVANRRPDLIARIDRDTLNREAVAALRDVRRPKVPQVFRDAFDDR